MSISAPAYKRSAAPLASRPAFDRNVGAELDNIFRLARADHPASAPPRAVATPPRAAEPPPVTQADLDAALDMLNRATRAMDMLQSRYQEVESYARDVADRAERDLAVAHGHARDWEARASAGESLVEEITARLTAAERRAEQAERRLHIAEHRAEAAEGAALEARDWLEAFYAKILNAFEARPFARAAA